MPCILVVRDLVGEWGGDQGSTPNAKVFMYFSLHGLGHEQPVSCVQKEIFSLLSIVLYSGTEVFCASFFSFPLKHRL